MFRSATRADLDEILSWTADSPITAVTEGQLLRGLAAGQYRLSWTWIAEDDGRILARAIWWGRPGGDHPLALDCVLARESAPDPAGLAAGLLDAAHREFRAHGGRDLPAYHLLLPIRWRDAADVRPALSWRIQAAARAGLSDQLERLRYEWTPECGVPAQSGRLTFRPEPDDEVFLAAFRRVAVRSLDGTTVAGVAAIGADQQSRDDMAHYLEMPGDRDWWRLAYTADGQLAGLAIPSRNDAGPVVGYLGVVPELRGHGYGGDLLAEITRLLAASGAGQIRADTDVGNRPMAAAFERAGYRNFAIRLVLSAPLTGTQG